MPLAVSPGTQRERLLTRRKLAAATLRSAHEVKVKTTKIIKSLWEAVATTTDQNTKEKMISVIRQAEAMRDAADAIIGQAQQGQDMAAVEIRETGLLPFRKRGPDVS